MRVTIDPGTQTGWALWDDSYILRDCGLGDPRSSQLHIVADIQEVWIESPVIYPRSKARPADIIKLAREAGRWSGIYEVHAIDVCFVEPFKWKGQLPKDVHHAQVWASLRPGEQATVHEALRGIAPSKRHNVLDAIGLGLWAAASQGVKRPCN